MKLNHLNLTVSDLAGARDFLATYFDLRVMPWDTGNDSGLNYKAGTGRLWSQACA